MIQMTIDNWQPDGFAWGDSIVKVISRLGDPESKRKYQENRVGLFYDQVNFNFDDGVSLSSIGFGEKSNLHINGINPFQNKQKFLEMISKHKKIQHYGLEIYPDIGIIIENFDSQGDPMYLSLVSNSEMQKYLAI